jgi:hypothetical protein
MLFGNFAEKMSDESACKIVLHDLISDVNDEVEKPKKKAQFRFSPADDVKLLIEIMKEEPLKVKWGAKNEKWLVLYRQFVASLDPTKQCNPPKLESCQKRFTLLVDYWRKEEIESLKKW